MKLKNEARRLLSPIRRLVSDRIGHSNKGPYKAYLDQSPEDNILQGWIFKPKDGSGHISVGVYTGEQLLRAGHADMGRNDVRGVHGCSAFCGFRFELTSAELMQVAEGNGRIDVRTMDDPVITIGSKDIVVDQSDPAVPLDIMGTCRRVFESDLSLLTDAIEKTGFVEAVAPLPPAPEFRQHAKMFTTDRVIPEVPENDHPAYLDYVRYRYRMDDAYNVQTGLEAADRYLYWYLVSYRSQEKHRVPLSKEIIEYLNAPIVMGGHQFAISRIMWWRMSGRPDMMGSINLNERDSYINTLFWWAHQDAPHMYFEDCLVPEKFVALLSGVHPSRIKDAYPLSYFTERYFINTPQLHFLDMGSAEGRKTLVMGMMVNAISRPDLLRYIPRKLIANVLADDENGSCDLEKFVNGMLAARITSDDDHGDGPTTVRLNRATYVEVLRQRLFDLESFEFMTRSPAGDRFEAAGMPVPGADLPEVDIQLIGPLAKASGLGQATRLSADILRATGLSVRGVDFDLDNPAPEGFSSDTMIEDYGPAKINMIHLNAESTPLAFAYQPDVFSNAYNIGYFFWELDKPAYCHYLGMDMLDEIWVSTEYGVEIYKNDAQGKPVVNVGMCYEANTDIDTESARAFVERRFRLNSSHYVCLVAFDSFSFVQRKNPVSVLKAFQKAFEGVPNARLIVKTQNRDSVFDPAQMHLWDQVEAMINTDNRIVIMNETLSYKDLLRLKAGSNCYVSLHKSEGWGFGMIEAMNLGVPVVCTAYSGNMDFCSDDTAWLVDYDLSLLKPEEYIFVRRGSEWAEPRIDHAAKQLRAAYDYPEERNRRAEAAKTYIQKNFSTEAISQRYGKRMKQILKDLKK